MKYLSLCSGIEAASVAWESLGWTPIAFSEIEAFPSAVLANRFPYVQNLGDMNDYEQWTIERPELIVAGTPCQSFSIAGLRQGLQDKRGGLAITFVRICDKYNPDYIVWENVPGVLTSKDNAFGCFLGALVGEDSELQPPGGKWKDAGCVFGPKRTIAWRCLDAQYFGLAQRRKRVFVIGCPRDGANPTKILFESSCVCGYTPQGSGSSQESSRTVGNCIACSFSKKRNTPPIRSNLGLNHTYDMKQHHNPQLSNTVSLTTSNCSSVRGDTPLVQVVEPKALAVDVYNYAIDGDCAATLTGACGGTNTSGPKAMVHCKKSLNSKDYSTFQVRRLTPKECEKLQGFPEGYTEISFRKKPNCPEGLRYKAVGNSMAVPVMRWIGSRIN